MLVFLFFYLFVGPVLADLLANLALTIGARNLVWIGTWGGPMGALVGMVPAVRSIRTDIPWRMTPLRLAFMIGCFHFALQRFWLILLLVLGESYHSTGASESVLSTKTLTIVDDLLRFPSVLLRQGQWAALLSSTFWALLCLGVLILMRKIEGSRKR